MPGLLPDLANDYRHPIEVPRSLGLITTDLFPTPEYRLTTKSVDEPLCIAHKLGLDISRIVVIAPSGICRTPNPVSLVFSVHGRVEMLSLECFCWALVPDMPLDRKHANDFRDHRQSPYTQLALHGTTRQWPTWPCFPAKPSRK